MTLLSSVHINTRRLRRRHRGHLVPIAFAAVIAAGAIALVAYLLWPTWEPIKSDDPARLRHPRTGGKGGTPDAGEDERRG